MDFAQEQLLYACESAVLDGQPAVEETPVFAENVDPPTSGAFLLHSRPGAARTIYLDFNGRSGRPLFVTSHSFAAKFSQVS